MNRIITGESSVSYTSSVTRKSSEVFQGKLVRSDHGDIVHSMFMPMHYEQNYAYPLVVWLHDDEDDERQLQRIMPFMSMRNYVATSPRGMRVANQPTVYGWRQTGEGVVHAEQAVEEATHRASERTHINSNRVILVGYGSGGTMALRIGLRNPHRYLGVVSIGGQMPSGERPLARYNECRELPLLICQGRHSEDYPEGQLCEDLRLLHMSGVNVTVRQYPCAEELVDLMLNDINIWIMERVTGCRQTTD